VINPKGYFYIEICFVLVILSYFSLIAAPISQVAFLNQQRQLFIENLSNDLSFASNEAFAKSKEVDLSFFAAQHFYTISSPGDQKKKMISFPGELTVKTNFMRDVIVFYADGQIAKAGTITITDSNGISTKLILQLSSGRFHIRVE
jgi:Tfp pilus assembly protein FimT